METTERVRIHGYKWVLCSDELIEELGDNWSPTVQLRLVKKVGDVLEFEVRQVKKEDNAKTVEE